MLDAGAGKGLGHLEELELAGGAEDYGEGVWGQGARRGLTCSVDDLGSRGSDRKVGADHNVVGQGLGANGS